MKAGLDRKYTLEFRDAAVKQVIEAAMLVHGGSGPDRILAAWRVARDWTLTRIAALLLLPIGAQAQPLDCFPPPIDTCGKGVVRGVTDGVAWTAWWVEVDFDWRRVHWYVLLGSPAAQRGLGANQPSGDAGAASDPRGANATVRSCQVAPHKEALAACRAMTIASDRTRPPPILYDVERSDRKDGTRPGHRLTLIGMLVPDGARHRAGAWCECWRGAVKLGKTQYCLVTKTESYAACRRIQ